MYGGLVVRRIVGWNVLVAGLVTILIGCTGLRDRADFWSARRDSSHQAPDPAEVRDAVIQVYAARTLGWRGILGVHTWIATKVTGAPGYTRYEVMGWGVDRGAPALRINRTGPDNYWFGERPEKLADVRGEGVDELIERIEAAVRSYPYPISYRLWPGPNSNTFTAYVGRAVPELRLDLPPTAIGKDYLPGGTLASLSTPGGAGVQLSLFGMGGLLVGLEEGLEVNVLGLTFGVDLNRPALKLPGIGRVGSSR
jgi:Protein of unknown function (DUF3750)